MLKTDSMLINFIKKNTFILSLLLVLLTVQSNYAIDPVKYVTAQASEGSFAIASEGKVAPLLLSNNDYPGVLRVAQHLRTDLKNVTGTEPALFKDQVQNIDQIIIIGTLGKSSLIDQLAIEGKINASALEGKWEKFTTQIVNNPHPGITQALVIAGSDKRGTIYGMYSLSNQIGVSPWYWWADIPSVKQSELHVLPGIHTDGEPKVKYRGIFINDEAPALTGWANEKFGGFNAKFYEHVFELILRMKGNYLWPAMWGKMFYVEDPKNAELANEYGVVIGTSHHEPLMRAHAEWEKFGTGEWNYNTNPENLIKFWEDGMKRMGDNESLVTIGMRGDGDEPMTEGTATALLEDIVKKQREIIANVTGKPAEETPQIWALYKEVQDYYDKGMKVPDDVTLLLCDDNWGNLRKLPPLNAAPRNGGYGIYYHFDYVGGPRSYKWINSNQIERTWEQMNLAYEHGVNKVWIVNVGDIKPMEFPIEFFLDMAWNPDNFTADNIQEYYKNWANKVFNGHFTDDIAHLMKMHTKYNATKKPEVLGPDTYSLTHFNEADKILSEYNKLAKKAKEINQKLPEEYHNAFYQLVLYPVVASANLHDLYISAAKNKLYAEQKRNSTNSYAERVQELFDYDKKLTEDYHSLADGKWNHMMSQTHIGYTSWRDPKENVIPKTITIEIPEKADLGISITNSSEENALVFDTFSNENPQLEIYNKGKLPFEYKIKEKYKWLSITNPKGTISDQKNISLDIDWDKAPKGTTNALITIEGAGKKWPVTLKLNNSPVTNVKGFVESNGYISMDAAHFSEKYEPENSEWKIVPNLGKTISSVISLPIKAGRIPLENDNPKLSYDIHFKTSGKVKVHAYFSPTINYSTREGMYYGLSFDDEKPVQVNYDSDPSVFNYNGKVPSQWERNVANSIKIITTEFNIKEVGNHTLHYYRVDEGLVLQKIVVETGDIKITYLGPPESTEVK